MLLDKIKKEIPKYAEGLKLVDFAFALPYSYAIVEGKKGRAMGVAMMLPEEVQTYDSNFEDLTVKSFLSKLDSLNVIERTLALSVANAVSQYHIDLSGALRIDVEKLLDKSIGKVAVIGNMPPIVEKVREAGLDAYVFERNAKLWDRGTLSDSLEYRLLPEVGAVLSTAAVLCNDTVDFVLERAKNAKTIFLIGATGQILPELLKGTGITHIASMKVASISGAVSAIKTGNYHEFVRHCEKYVVSV